MKKEMYGLFIFIIFAVMLCSAGSASAADSFYSIQAGTFGLNASEYAKKHYAALSKKLDEQNRSFLRIEEGSKYLVVKTGRFSDIASAIITLKAVKLLVPDAFIVKVNDFNGLKVIAMYNEEDADEADDEAKNISASTETVADNRQPSAFYGPSADELQKKKEAEKEEKLNKLFGDVSAYFDKQDYKKAAALIRDGLKQWPDNPDLHAWYGATLLDTGFPERAYEEYRKAAELLPEVPEFHAGAGNSLLEMHIGRAKLSVESFNKALKIDPNNVTALEGLGILYVSIGRKQLASEIYDRLVKVDQIAAGRLNEYIIYGLDWEK